MTNIPPQSRHSVYQLSENLRPEAIPLSFRVVAPSEAEREELVLRKLGVKCWGRLHHFRHCYSQGWGEGAGKPLSPRALEAFYRFVQGAEFSDAKKPSLFLTDAGNLELCWEDQNGKAVQVEFTPTGAEFFLESDGVEDAVPHTHLIELSKRLSN